MRNSDRGSRFFVYLASQGRSVRVCPVHGHRGSVTFTYGYYRTGDKRKREESHRRYIAVTLEETWPKVTIPATYLRSKELGGMKADFLFRFIVTLSIGTDSTKIGREIIVCSDQVFVKVFCSHQTRPRRSGESIYLLCKGGRDRRAGCQNLRFPKQSGLIATSRNLLKGSKAQVLQPNSIRPDSPLSIFRGGILFFHFLWGVGMLFGPAGYGRVPQQAA